MQINLTSESSTGLVLETLPSGDVAWLRPEGSDERVNITDAGRAALEEHLREDTARAAAVALLFAAATTTFDCACSASGNGGACPFSATSARQLEQHYRDVHFWTVALCAACGQPQSRPSCATREHWGVN